MATSVESYRLFVIFHLKALKALDGAAIVSTLLHFIVFTVISHYLTMESFGLNVQYIILRFPISKAFYTTIIWGSGHINCFAFE